MKEISLFFNVEETLYLPDVSIVNATISFPSKVAPVKDITQLISFWSYTCLRQYNSLDFIIGTSDNLLLLKKLLPESDIVRINKQGGCTVSITYKTVEAVCVWSVVIDGEFNIVKRGEKQGLVYPEYITPKSLTSRIELLHNY